MTADTQWGERYASAMDRAHDMYDETAERLGGEVWQTGGMCLAIGRNYPELGDGTVHVMVGEHTGPLSWDGPEDIERWGVELYVDEEPYPLSGRQGVTLDEAAALLSPDMIAEAVELMRSVPDTVAVARAIVATYGDDVEELDSAVLFGEVMDCAPPATPELQEGYYYTMSLRLGWALRMLGHIEAAEAVHAD